MQQIDLLDNTTRIFGVRTPNSFLSGNGDPRALDYGLAGLAADAPAIDPITGQPITGPAGLSLSDTITGAIAAVNAEGNFLVDQIRAAKNLPPVPAGSRAPGITVGLSPDTQKLILIGGAVLIGAFLFLRRKS